MKRFCAWLIVPVLLLSCAKNIQTSEAIKQGVLEHLAKRDGSDLNMSAMDLDVTAVSYRENEADATIGFRTKGGSQVLMSIKYTLERKGDKWAVKAKQDPQAGASGHGMSAPQGELPADHPPVDTPAKQ